MIMERIYLFDAAEQLGNLIEDTLDSLIGDDEDSDDDSDDDDDDDDDGDDSDDDSDDGSDDSDKDNEEDESQSQDDDESDESGSDEDGPIVLSNVEFLDYEDDNDGKKDLVIFE